MFVEVIIWVFNIKGVLALLFKILSFFGHQWEEHILGCLKKQKLILVLLMNKT